MIQRQLTLRLTPSQEAQLHTWLFQLTGVWNWAIRKIEQDAKDGILYTPKAFHNLLADHGKKLGIPSHTLQGMLDTAYTAWQRCSKKVAKRPRLTGQRNKLTSIPFPDPFKTPDDTRIHVPGIGYVRFHAHDLPPGRLKSGRIVKRASGWYLCLFNVGGFVPLVLPSPYGNRLLFSIVQPAGSMTADGSFTRPLRGLSRMKGNFHVRF